MRFDGFVGPTYESDSKAADAQRAVNVYPELLESGTAKNRFGFYGTPGLTTFCTLPTAPVRGLWANDPSGIAGTGRLFAAGGNTLYEITSGGVATSMGVIGDDAAHSPVQIFPNGTQLFIVSAGKGYLHDGTTLTEVVNARTGAYLDGYFIVNPPETPKRFYHSKQLDGTDWNELDFATKEGYPDNCVSILADHSELWLFGDETTEVWRNEGDIDNVFRRDPGAFIHHGSVAAWGPVNVYGGVGWLGGDARGRVTALYAEGFRPVRLSTHAIEAKWGKYSTVADAISYSYTENGHTFWVITFPTANATWAYDFTTKMWHERASGADLDRHRGRCHTYVFGKHLVGDHTTGVVYQMSSELLDDAGTAIVRMRRAPHITNEQKNIFFHSLQLDMEVGGGSDPEVTLAWSNDGGYSFNTAKTQTAGSAGEYSKRVIWRRLGKGRDRVFEVRSSAAIKHAWVDAYLNLTAGTA
ncbi:MAG: hypothetical protein ACRELT_10105 [Longimicrobiales bacterium]